MNPEDFKQIINKNPEKFPLILEEFNKTNANLFEFNNVSQKSPSWLQLWKGIFAILRLDCFEKYHILALNTIRILSRDKFSVQQNNLDADIDCLLHLAQLTPDSTFLEKCTSTIGEDEDKDKNGAIAIDDDSSIHVGNGIKTGIIIEAEKCLCNLVFQNNVCRRRCARQNIADFIIKRMSSTMQIPSALELYDMKLLFLITALEPSVRSRVMIELNGLAYMTESLNERLSSDHYTDEQIDVIVELLKAMHNIISYNEKSPSENEIQNLHLTGVIRELLYRFGAMANDKERSIISNSINVLIYVSSSCLGELMMKCDSNTGNPSNSDVDLSKSKFKSIRVNIFEKHNVYALDVILKFLQLLLGELENGGIQHDLLSPVLTVLVKCVSSNRIMRHYVRSVILPPLKDATCPPEIGTELRNYLCRLQSNIDQIVRDLTYELLFICCKKNARRMVKYFGYGNMAGLFFKKGILDCRRIETEFSSDNDESDTEEYKKIQHNINPVTGTYMKHPTAPKEMDRMTEEEKEYHAMQLVHVIDKLQRGGLIKPCNISDDGKLQPVEHILELQKDLTKNIHTNHKN